jgi:hypothetical protein
VVESDIRYYRRRAFEEMAAANRAVTDAARQRRMLLVDLYVGRLEALNAPSPFDEADMARPGVTPAFAWQGASRN